MSTGKKRLLAYVIMLISLLISVKLVKDIFRLWHADERLIEAKEELLAAKQEQLELEQELKEMEKGEWWEKQVRNTLKMARSKEEVVVVPEAPIVDGRFEVEGVGQIEVEELSPTEKWWRVFVY